MANSLGLAQSTLRRCRRPRAVGRRRAVPGVHAASVLSRNFAVYAVGEGWTGAFGTGRFDQQILGHDDDDEYAEADEEGALPLLIYDAPIHSVALGWGHTAIISDDKSTLLVTGRPHDFSALLRLQRLPVQLRDYMVRQTLASLQGDPDQEDLRIHPSALVGRFVTWMADIFQTEQQQREWEIGARFSMLPTWTPLELPNDDTPAAVACSAGLTAVVGKSGKLYTVGLNGFGQCGIGRTSNNVWQPTEVTGLSTEFAQGPRAEMPQEHGIQNVALGLQHALAVNEVGEIFAFGKGDRGQLGQEIMPGESSSALPIKKAFVMDVESPNRPTYSVVGPVQQIVCGMLHSAALTEDNQVLIWGKNILPSVSNDDLVAADARIPVVLQGLPAGVKVEQIACGSHHTAVLLADGSVWAVGISSDTNKPIHDPFELIPAGTIDMPPRQFAAHMDRTTIVGADGRQVLQVHLWKDPELREYAVFTPHYVDRLLEQDASTRIREIHRSWKHSVIVTD